MGSGRAGVGVRVPGDEVQRCGQTLLPFQGFTAPRGCRLRLGFKQTRADMSGLAREAETDAIGGLAGRTRLWRGYKINFGDNAKNA